MSDLIVEIIEGAQAGQQLQLDPALDVGREVPGGLSLDDSQVSRHHARFSVTGGSAQVEDLGSTNGTYVNDSKIDAPRTLVPGDKVRIGTTVFQLRSPEQVARQASAVIPMPQLTAVQTVLQPVPERELSGIIEAPQIPALRRAETPAAYVPPVVGGVEPAAAGEAATEAPVAKKDDGPAESYNAPQIEGLVDARVKRQTNVAAFALLAIIAIAIIIYFGAIR